jgi:hypothetical protein
MTNFDTMFGEIEDRQKFDSDFLSLKVGKNPIRILSDFKKVENVFKGKYPNSTYQRINLSGTQLAADETITTQGWAWVIDRTTGELKIGQFGVSILTAIKAIKDNPDYAFDTFPMPYDITINNTGDGANRYSVVAARQNTEVTADEIAKLNKKKTIADIVQAIIDKQSKPAGVSTEKVETTVEYPDEKIDADNIDWEPKN